MEADIPLFVCLLPLSDKLEWHRQRIELELPVAEFVEAISNENLTEEEIILKLEKIRSKIERLESWLALLKSENGKFEKLRLEYCFLRASKNPDAIKLLEIKSELVSMCVEFGINPSVLNSWIN